MATVARATVILCSLAFVMLSLSDAARRAERKPRSGARVNFVAAAAAMAESEGSACQRGEVLLWAVQKLVNGALKVGLSLADPFNMTVRDNDEDISLLGLCKNHHYVKTFLEVSGFEGAGVESIRCTESGELEEGTMYTFGINISVGGTLRVGGSDRSDFEVCGLHLSGHSISSSFDLVEPGLFTKIRVKRDGFLGWKVDQVDQVSVNYGTTQKYRCGFENLQGWVGKKLAGLCSKSLTFFVKRIMNNFKGKIDAALAELANEAI